MRVSGAEAQLLITLELHSIYNSLLYLKQDLKLTNCLQNDVVISVPFCLAVVSSRRKELNFSVGEIMALVTSEGCGVLMS